MTKKNKKEPSGAMQAYMDNDKSLKILEETKIFLRKTVIEELKQDPDGFDGISYSRRELIKFNDDAFYEWIATSFPNQVDKCTKKTIDYEQFENLVASGEIVYSELPESVFKQIPQDVINISANKGKKHANKG